MIYWVAVYLMLYAPLQLEGCSNAHLCDVVGLHGSQERGALKGIIRKLVRLGYLFFLSTPTFDVLCNTADSNLLAIILNNSCHFLHKLLPPIKITRYSMRLRSHNRELPTLDSNIMSKKRFLTRMLYKYSWFLTHLASKLYL